MSSFVFWSLLLSLVGGLVVQWVAMRATHHRRLQELQAEHHQVLVRLRNDLEAVTRRMHQSERDRDLAVAATARSEAAVRRSEAAAAALSARRALERELDEDSQRRRAPPSTDGFADTQVMAHETEASSLLVQ